MTMPTDAAETDSTIPPPAPAPVPDKPAYLAPVEGGGVSTTPAWLQIQNANRLYAFALDDIKRLTEERDRLIHASQAVEAAILSSPTCDDYMRAAARILAAARGVK